MLCGLPKILETLLQILGDLKLRLTLKEENVSLYIDIEVLLGMFILLQMSTSILLTNPMYLIGKNLRQNLLKTQMASTQIIRYIQMVKHISVCLVIRTCMNLTPHTQIMRLKVNKTRGIGSTAIQVLQTKKTNMMTSYMMTS